MTVPLVSVLMTVYNTGKYLELAVRSLLSQSLTDIELILIDDGSTDNSLSVIRMLASEDARIRFATGPNRGIVAASNEGLQLARGEFIARMDSDDISDPARLEKQVRFLLAHPEVVALSGWYGYMDACGRHLTVIRMPTDDATIQRSCLSGVPAMCHGCLMVRRKAISQIGGYDPAFARATEDLDLKQANASRL